jgi:hypothetical protein
MLLEGLPAESTTFDVITHSRGGLVLRTWSNGADAFGPLADRFKLGHAVLGRRPRTKGHRWRRRSAGRTRSGGWRNLLELFPENPFTSGA